jgi:hypothetical protein
MRHRVVLIGASAIALVALAWPPAVAKDLGSDVIGNISPESRLGAGALVDRYPLSAFSLDYSTDVGITELDGVPPTIAHWAAAQIWSLWSFLIKSMIDLFAWAFSLDLLGVEPGQHGALEPVADAITSIYENVLGEAWMAAAIVLAGIWGIWRALIQRRYTETLGALTVSVVFVVIALFFVYEPEKTVGTASRWTNELSLAFLAGANTGSLDDPAQAKRRVADQLYSTLIYEPWVVLQFGGLQHCVDLDKRDDDGYPKPVGPHDPARDVCRNHLKQGQDGHGGYAQRFLRYPAGSDQREAEYEALRSGEVPANERDGQFRGYEVDRSDSPAVDVQQEGGAFQRLTLALVFFVGSLGAVLLLGFLSLAVILAQVVALVVLGFAPVALVIGIFPGAGHDFFRNWLGKLGTALFIKALYSLVIAVVVAVSAALAASTTALGFLFAFGLQAIFFWAIFIYRKQITARLVGATTGLHYRDERVPRINAVQHAGDVAMRPFSALVGFGMGRHSSKQESAISGTKPDPIDRDRPPPGADSTEGTDVRHNGHVRTRSPQHAQPAGPGALLRTSGGTDQTRRSDVGDEPDAAAPAPGPAGQPSARHPVLRDEFARRHGDTPDEPRGASAHQPGPARHGRVSGSAAAAETPEEQQPAPEPTPRAAHEDVMHRARELRSRDRPGNDEQRPRS